MFYTLSLLCDTEGQKQPSGSYYGFDPYIKYNFVTRRDVVSSIGTLRK